MSCGSASRNNPNGIPLFDMAHDEESAGAGLAYGDKAFFANRMMGSETVTASESPNTVVAS